MTRLVILFKIVNFSFLFSNYISFFYFQILSGESARNRFGRPYISGRPLLTCDRWRIIEMYVKGIKKIRIAQELRVTHSCVSKVIRRYNETGVFEARSSKTASCACPGSAEQHNLQICRHLQYRNELEKSQNAAPFTVDWSVSSWC
ncbi:unnamed protein product [Enterobius vermicularis]|uniref:Paired domain-containing protein n=1 Tax=Enterobius vermicularis TaxID=51028 RepID=A0A0N4VC85_ENTVE|nr:unnamed protein product [Enterobius vermicularis]